MEETLTGPRKPVPRLGVTGRCGTGRVGTCNTYVMDTGAQEGALHCGAVSAFPNREMATFRALPGYSLQLRSANAIISCTPQDAALTFCPIGNGCVYRIVNNIAVCT